MPALLSSAIGQQLANFGHPRCDLGSGSRLRGTNLFAQQLLIDQAVESGIPFDGRERIRVTPVEDRLKCDFLFPVALQHNVTVHTAYDAIHNRAGRRQACERHRQDNHENALS